MTLSMPFHTFTRIFKDISDIYKPPSNLFFSAFLPQYRHLGCVSAQTAQPLLNFITGINWHHFLEVDLLHVEWEHLYILFIRNIRLNAWKALKASCLYNKTCELFLKMGILTTSRGWCLQVTIRTQAMMTRKGHQACHHNWVSIIWSYPVDPDVRLP